MLYDLDMTMRVEKRGGRKVLIADLDQRQNLLRVMSAYAEESRSDGYASSSRPERGAKARDRARAFQLWEHGVLSVSAIRKIFPVTRRTLNTYWGINSSRDSRLRLWGSVNPEHLPLLIEMVQRRAQGQALPLRTEIASHLEGPIEPTQRTSMAVAANLLGLDLRGEPLHDVGVSEPVAVAPSPAAPPSPSPAGSRSAPAPVPTPLEGQMTVEECLAEPTDMSDPDTRAAVELGERAFNPELEGFDDTGDKVLEQFGEELDLDEVADDEYEEQEVHP